jgi:hypothetical protein
MKQIAAGPRTPCRAGSTSCASRRDGAAIGQQADREPAEGEDPVIEEAAV